jgi:hypothetical protein
LPQPPSPVKNRPLSNAVGFGGSPVYVATLLKNRFNTTSLLALQNVDDTEITVNLAIYDADSPSSPPIPLTGIVLGEGESRHFDAGLAGDPLSDLLPATFNGSVVVSAVKGSPPVPAAAAATALELQLVGLGAVAFEGVPTPASTIYMATALCNAFGGQTTFYAVQNTNQLEATNVTVHYSNGISASQAVAPGAKASFGACAAAGMPAGFSGAAKVISSNTDIVVINKVSGAGLLTASVGEAAGANRIYLPYVRWTSDANYLAGLRQRTFIAIQNIGAAAVDNVHVRYIDKAGVELGVHTILSIAAGAKANSRAIEAVGDAAKLLEFGQPEGNGGSGFGGGVIIEAAPGAQLIALARVTTRVGANDVAEDYNAFVTGSGIVYLPYVQP